MIYYMDIPIKIYTYYISYYEILIWRYTKGVAAWSLLILIHLIKQSILFLIQALNPSPIGKLRKSLAST